MGKTINDPRLIALSFYFLIPPLLLYWQYLILNEYITQTHFYVGLGFFIVGLVGFIITFLKGVFPLKDDGLFA